MDRVKALRRAAAALVLVVGAALILSCSADNGAVDGSSKTFDETGCIYGYVTGPDGAIENANVRWVCKNDSTLLGSVLTGTDGYYEITSETWWSSHASHDLGGTATKSGYKNG